MLFVLAILAVAETSLNRISQGQGAGDRATPPGPRAPAALQRLVTAPGALHQPAARHRHRAADGPGVPHHAARRPPVRRQGRRDRLRRSTSSCSSSSPRRCPRRGRCCRRSGRRCSPPRPTDWLVSFPPLRSSAAALIGLTNVLLPGKGLKQGPFVSEQELLGIVGAAADDEVIEHEERELIESIIEFGDTVAREVMVPRPDMVIVEQRRHGHRRPRPGDRPRGQPPAGARRRRRRHRRPGLHQGPDPRGARRPRRRAGARPRPPGALHPREQAGAAG